MGGRFICSSQQHAGTNGRNYVNGKRRAQINNQYIEEAKSEHKELDGGRTNWGGQRDTIDAMDKVLTASTKIWDRR